MDEKKAGAAASNFPSIEQLATKTDIADLRTDLGALVNSLEIRLLLYLGGLGAAFLTAIFFLLQYFRDIMTTMHMELSTVVGLGAAGAVQPLGLDFADASAF